MYDSPIEPYHKKGLRLYLNDKLYFPNRDTRQTVLMDTHDSLFGAHRGFRKTLSIIKRHFYWPRMKRDIHDDVKTCQKSQESENLTQKAFGTLRPFPPPQRKWEGISIDFIFDLPQTEEKHLHYLLQLIKSARQHTLFHCIQATPHSTEQMCSIMKHINTVGYGRR